MRASGKKGPKVQTPLAFKLGEGKAIRGWEECVKTMTLGEKLEVTIGPMGFWVLTVPIALAYLGLGFLGQYLSG